MVTLELKSKIVHSDSLEIINIPNHISKHTFIIIWNYKDMKTFNENEKNNGIRHS